jgi:hypothetical protein
MMDVAISSETSVLTKATGRKIPEDVIILRREVTCIAKQKKTLWPLVRERTIPTERPQLVDEI